MTDNEAMILTGLEPAPGAEPKTMRLRQLGGKKNSHHSCTAARLCIKGWVSCQARRAAESIRPTLSYRITAAGRQALANHRLSRMADSELSAAMRKFKS